ncbi:DUF6790 family protein [Aquabacter sp. CN5-332]|uniref:DUF6790 family protein n=1 Tax=Aquabacter sp. CN5-332 TaxID=3156608 RepID=UPI0032B3203C
MIGDAIKFVLANLPALLFVAAFVVAAARKAPPSFATRLFDWLLLLSVGVEALWAGLFHVFFPHIAAASIGWQVSPFQFEIGVADISIGIVGIVAFWRSLDFKEAAVWYITLFYIGVAIGHVREAMSGDMAPDNFGLLLIITVVQIILLPVLLWLARREANAKS